MKHEIYIVGMGPGREEDMTQEALTVLDSCDVIVGYTVYLNLLGERFWGKRFCRLRCARKWSDAGCAMRRPRRESA